MVVDGNKRDTFDLRVVCALAEDIEVALRVRYRANNPVVDVSWTVGAGVGFHPVEVLGVGGEGQHNERRQQDDSLHCISFFVSHALYLFCHYRRGKCANCCSC